VAEPSDAQFTLALAGKWIVIRLDPTWMMVISPGRWQRPRRAQQQRQFWFDICMATVK
jgi:hypothetical protein